MNRRKIAGLTVYLLLTGAITAYYFEAGQIVLGVLAPVSSGLILAVITRLRIEFHGISKSDVWGELWLSGILVVAPILWYLTFGCALGCPG